MTCFGPRRPFILYSPSKSAIYAGLKQGRTPGPHDLSRRYYSNPLEVFHKKPLFQKPSAPPTLPTDRPIDEERYPSFDASTAFWPHPGQTVLGGLELVTKLGYGGKFAHTALRLILEV